MKKFICLLGLLLSFKMNAMKDIQTLKVIACLYLSQPSSTSSLDSLCDDCPVPTPTKGDKPYDCSFCPVPTPTKAEMNENKSPVNFDFSEKEQQSFRLILRK